VRGVRLSNVRILTLFCAVGLLFSGSNASAIERAGTIGVLFAAPVQLKPEVDDGDRVISIDTAYFVEEQWAALLTFPERTLNPYVAIKFLYSFDPKNDFGWNFAAGAEWNLRSATGMDNLVFCGEVAAWKLFVRDGSNLLSLDLIRLGLAWNF
jgi:hypothetical protein